MRVEILKGDRAVHRAQDNGEVREFKIVGIRIHGETENGSAISRFYDTKSPFYLACAALGTTSNATEIENGKIELN